jgi:hypothetical protein
VGKLIGYLILLAFLGGPLFGLWYVSKEPIEFLGHDGRESGEVIRCSSKRLSGSSSRYIKVPVVKRPSGQLVYGTVDEIRFISECDDLVGKTLPIIFDRNNPEKAKINTFLEMWFQPALMFLLCLVIYPASYMGHKKKKLKKSRI